MNTSTTWSTLHTFGEAQLLGDGASDFGSGGVAVEVHLVHAVPINVGAAQLQAMDGWGGAGERGERREGNDEHVNGWRVGGKRQKIQDRGSDRHAHQHQVKIT